MPRVSVVVPVYNGEAFVGEAVESILAQGHTDTEVIVVDDGSTDGTQEVLKACGGRVTILSQENQGPAAARNAGIKQATGSIIGLLDADDLWPDGRLAEALSFLEQGSPYDYVRGRVQYFRKEGGVVTEYTEPVVLEALVGACLYRASVFEQVGFFDEEMRQGEDFDFAIRLREAGMREKRLDTIMLRYRRHANNLTNSEAVIKRGQVDAFRKKLARKRLAAEPS